MAVCLVLIKAVSHGALGHDYVALGHTTQAYRRLGNVTLKFVSLCGKGLRHTSICMSRTGICVPLPVAKIEVLGTCGRWLDADLTP
jgi:hypothetical protein